MTAQDLKNSILQLAIQGKLVEQREEEGTAKELLKKIEIEKKQLIKEGKIKKEKPLPTIKEDEIPFDIPESWEWVRLGDALDIARGGSPRPIKAFITDSEDGVNWIKIGDTDKGGKYINGTNEKITKEGMKKSRFVKKGDFLLSNSMSFGRPYILNIDGCIHDGWLVLSQRVKVFNKDFLYYLLSSRMVFNQFQSIVSGAVVNNLNSDKVRLTIVPIPSLEEQKRIVEKIEDLMPYVDKYDIAYSEVEELNKKFPEDMQKSILQYAIQGKLVEQREEDGTAEELYKQIQEEKKKLIKDGKIKQEKVVPKITEDEVPFYIPESWKWVRLGDVFQIINGDRGKNYPSKDKLTNKGIPFVSALNIEKYTISEEKLLFMNEEQYAKLGSGKLIKGDLVLCIRGSLGKNGRYPFERGAIASSLVILRSYVENETFYSFITKYLNTELFSSEVMKYNNGTAQPNLGARDLAKFIIPLPPHNEQKRIVEKIEELFPYAKQLI